jgi:hypothetical protein
MEVSPSTILNIGNSLGVVVQLFIAFILTIYMVYAFLMLRQVKLLNKSFRTDAAKFLGLSALIHFLATLFLFLFTILVTIL